MLPFDIDPAALIEEMADYGQRLGKGLDKLVQCDPPAGGVSEKELVYSEDKLQLYHYLPAAGVKQSGVPLLIVYALVNRPYMTDLQEDRSTIKGLLAAGQDVYLVDWGYPDSADCGLNLDDYINGYIDRCVDQLRQRHGVERINLLGICQGGAFSLCYTAQHQEKIRNLITMVTPVDFQTPDNMLSHWAKHLDVDLMVDTLGNIPGEMLNWTFLTLKPFALMGQKYVHMVDLVGDEEKLENFIRMERWIADSPDQAGEAFRQFIKSFYQDNGLVNGSVMLDGKAVDLKQINCPLLNIYGEQDHLVPPASSRALAGLTASDDYTEVAFPGGHIGIYVSGKAQKLVSPSIGEWLDKRSK